MYSCKGISLSSCHFTAIPLLAHYIHLFVCLLFCHWTELKTDLLLRLTMYITCLTTHLSALHWLAVWHVCSAAELNSEHLYGCYYRHVTFWEISSDFSLTTVVSVSSVVPQAIGKVRVSIFWSNKRLTGQAMWLHHCSLPWHSSPLLVCLSHIAPIYGAPLSSVVPSLPRISLDLGDYTIDLGDHLVRGWLCLLYETLMLRFML
jgi:hypothetical protein